MKMIEEVNHKRKEYVYEEYTKIVDNYKEYDKITKVKMIKTIYEIYSDYQNIISLCTSRELKYLRSLLNPSQEEDELTTEDLILYWHDESKSKEAAERLKKYKEKKEKVAWEEKTLRDKFLITMDNKNNKYVIPEEIIDSVKQAIKKVKWKEQKKIDELNELIVGYMKIQGACLLTTLIEFASAITDLDKNTIYQHIISNRLISYYLFFRINDIEEEDNRIPIIVYQEYLEVFDELVDQRKEQATSGTIEEDIGTYKMIFYNDFNLRNDKIKKFFKELANGPVFYWDNFIAEIRICALLNGDREYLKDYLKKIFSRIYKSPSKLIQLLDDAMDEMPSGALNGLTPNMQKELQRKEQEMVGKKELNYHPQQQACFGEKESDLFYKIYMALLEYTNQKYNIKPNFKIYKKKALDPKKLTDIIEKLWENKDRIIQEFIDKNPYNLKKEELESLDGFKKGFRTHFVLAKYEEEYTALIGDNKIYMIKGLNCNIDQIIPYQQVPCFITTSLVEYKGNIVFDGIISAYPINFGVHITEMVEKDYNHLMKYYHL